MNLIFLFVIICSSCFNNDSGVNNNNIIVNHESIHKKNESNIIDTNLFAYKNILKTIDFCNMLSYEKINELDTNEITKWILPIIKKDGYSYMLESPYKYKKLSFQGLSKNYYSFLILVHGNEGYDEELDHYFSDQYFVNINKKGELIDFLLIYRYFPGSSFGEESYSKNKGLLLNRNMKSIFSCDSIAVIEKDEFLKRDEKSNKEDEFFEIYKTIYVIDTNGIINKIGNRELVEYGDT